MNDLENNKKSTSIKDEMVEEANLNYSRMSLLELLAEENLVAEFLHKRKLDTLRQELLERLRSNIEEKLR